MFKLGDLRASTIAIGMVAALCFFSAAAELNAASPSPSETPVPNESLSIGDATIHVEIEPGDLNLSRTRIVE